jgi:8-oxo-dGTP pyrophosphatase MutT (NUDIX family)
MYKERLLEFLESYQTTYLEEQKYKQQIIDFINFNSIISGKTNQDGHITGSSWIVSPDRKKVLLTHHHKLERWLQLGGHTENEEAVEIAAIREAKEESGLASIRCLYENIFDLDVHTIPARGSEKEHIHYDVRFVFEADPMEALCISSESKDVKWVDLDKVHTYSQSKSLLRMVQKTYKLLKEK